MQIGRPENIVGWYHSHPGYGCWLSGIDVMTQKTNQQFQDPFLAVVVRSALLLLPSPRPHLLAHPCSRPCYEQIDPNRTVSAGKVEIGAFRTYPEVSGHVPQLAPDLPVLTLSPFLSRSARGTRH